jgi:hypothetical protein
MNALSFKIHYFYEIVNRLYMVYAHQYSALLVMISSLIYFPLVVQFSLTSDPDIVKLYS